MFRKMASKSRPKLEIQQKGDKFSIKLTTIMATREENFNIDEEFEQDSHSGVRMKVRHIPIIVYIIIIYIISVRKGQFIRLKYKRSIPKILRNDNEAWNPGPGFKVELEMRFAA